MKVILTQDVKSLGKKGAVVEVSDSYARNVILKKNLGLEANAVNLNDLKQRRASEANRAKKQLEEAQELASRLEGKSVTVSMRSGAGGKAFGSITGKEIAEAYQNQWQVELDRRKIQLPEAIKTFGTHEVPIRLHPSVTAKLYVTVTESKA